MSGDYTDWRLVMQVQSGHEEAFNLLVLKYRRRLLKLALRYTRNLADAEDVVQETFLKAFRAIGHFRGDAAFYSWLHRIAVNSAKTAAMLQARQRTLFLSCDDSAELQDGAPALSHIDTPQDLALTEELGRVLEAAFGELPEEQRMAIALRELQGLSYSQVADSMACPIGTVRSRIFRGRDAINAGLQRIFEGPVGGVPRERAPAGLRRPVASLHSGLPATAV